MIYALLGIGVLGTIFFLLWRWESEKRKGIEVKKGLSDARVKVLSEILKLERKLKTASEVDAEKIKKQIKEIEDRVLGSKPGDVVSDIFGTSDGAQEG